ncbi:hypothetical protein SAMN04490355_1004135 [Pelosinus propionicus DSM 13327]|uniref:Uncharacterized protein n=2 Tax=Pelosinus TaxID=365348 RepID=A0A1I4HNF1_9FIRM|nr:hypothetical protein SAMN04490355_1004135 [Pelosinus propionicus DSM 13327]
MNTYITMIRTDGNNTWVHVYGANSVDDLCSKMIDAFNKEDCQIYYHQDLTILSKILVG